MQGIKESEISKISSNKIEKKIDQMIYLALISKGFCFILQ